MAGVQVQIVTYNSAHAIAACLRSVLEQTATIERVLIIDNASRDETLENIRRVGSAFVHVRQMSTNSGYAAGHNNGFREAFLHDMDVVVTLNPDVVLDPQYVQRCVAALQGGAVGGVSGKLARPQAQGGGLIDSAGLAMGHFYHVHDRGSGQPDVGQFDALENVWGICGAAAVYNVRMLRQLEPDGRCLDESFFLYKEDVDLCWRAMRLGWVFRYEPTAVAQHDRGWQRGGEVSAVARAHSFANQVALLVHHVPWSSPKLWCAAVVESIRFGMLVVRRPSVARQTLTLIRRNWRENQRVRRQLQGRPVRSGEVSM